MPTAISLTRGRLQTRPCSVPSSIPPHPPASTPSHGLPLKYDTAYPLIAPVTRIPSSPRLMRPLFSVMHSPRLTKRNGVLTRSIPPSTPIGTPHQPRSVTRAPPSDG